MNILKIFIIGLVCGVWTYLIMVPHILPYLQSVFGETAGLIVSYPLDLIGYFLIFEVVGKKVK